MEATEQANDQATQAQTESAEAAPTQGTGSPDTSEAQAALLQRVEALEKAREPEAPEDDDSWLNELWPDQGPEAPEGFEEDGYGAEAQQEYAEQPQYGDLDALIQEQVTAAVENTINPYLAEQEREQRNDALISFAEKHPDFKEPEMLNKIAREIAPMADQYDDQTLFTYPPLAIAVYKAIKADAAAEAETDAGEASGRGASVETGAGGGAPSEESYEETAKREILSAGGEGSAFA